MVQWKVHVWINQWQFIMIIYTAIQKFPSKVWTVSFVDVNLHPHHCLYYSECIKKIAPAIKTGETAYFRNHEGSYYYVMLFLWKNTTLIKQMDVMSIIYRFAVGTPHGKPS